MAGKQGLPGEYEYERDRKKQVETSSSSHFQNPHELASSPLCTRNLQG